LFSVIKDVFKKCNEVFSQEIFILGCKYVSKKKFVCQLLNFVVGQAKMAIYLSRKKKIEQDVVQNVVLFFNLVQSRILIDFYYYKCIGDLFSFENIWSCNDALFVFVVFFLVSISGYIIVTMIFFVNKSFVNSQKKILSLSLSHFFFKGTVHPNIKNHP